ncbi:MAG TPA: hypothetical protein VF912_02065 [Anaeromyxobacter sp.]
MAHGRHGRTFVVAVDPAPEAPSTGSGGCGTGPDAGLAALLLLAIALRGHRLRPASRRSRSIVR